MMSHNKELISIGEGRLNLSTFIRKIRKNVSFLSMAVFESLRFHTFASVFQHHAQDTLTRLGENLSCFFMAPFFRMPDAPQIPG